MADDQPDYTIESLPERLYTQVKLPDGMLRIWEPNPGSDDMSRMYVLDVLGIDVTVRWKDDGKYAAAYGEEPEPAPALLVSVDYDAESTPIASGPLQVGVGMNIDTYGGINGWDDGVSAPGVTLCKQCGKSIDFYKDHWWSKDDDFMCPDGEQEHEPHPNHS